MFVDLGRSFDLRVKYDCKLKGNYYKTLFWVVVLLCFGLFLKLIEFRKIKFLAKKGMSVIVFMPIVWAVSFLHH